MLTLLEIQKLQFGDKSLAEKELSNFFAASYGQSIEQVQINTKPESLNSLNGIVSFAGGEKYFFKTHVEENEQLAEYYNAELLQKAGYPVLRPRKLETIPGQQLALYEIVTLPTLFDEIKTEEDKCLLQENTLSREAEKLVSLNRSLDKTVFACYESSLSEENQSSATAPIHQLFGHRLASDGRLGLFYKERALIINGQTVPFAQLMRMKWTINGTTYDDTLGDCLERAQSLMNPARPTRSVVGHGDAHNGNVFVDYSQKQLLYFDPAFAGRHSPLLDLTKPLFHNVFARWMYFPKQVDDEFELVCRLSEEEIKIEHNYQPTKLRQEIFSSKLQNVLFPLLELLDRERHLSPQWQGYLRSALLCCPLLTVNLFAAENPSGTLAEKYSTKVKLLGFVMTITAASTAKIVNRSDTLHGMFTQIFAP